jgi:fibronectin type 3 domain-containing protein
MFQDINRGLFQGESYSLISWEPNPSNTPFNITEYKIYRKQASTSFDFTFLAKVSGNSLSFEDQTIDLEKEYLYAVSSVDINGNESVLSEVIKEN